MGYTLTDRSGEVIGRGLTVEQVAEERLSHDGGRWEIRLEPGHAHADDDIYALYVWEPALRQWVQAWSCGHTVICYAASEAAAWPKLAALILHAEWDGMTAWSDADYDAMLAGMADDIAAQQEG